MPTIRRATIDDAALIAEHRHRMFADNQFADEDHLAQMDAVFEPWVCAHLAAGTYIGLLLEHEETKEILAGAGVFFHDFPPHWMDFEPPAPTCSTSTPHPNPADAATPIYCCAQPSKSAAPAAPKS